MFELNNIWNGLSGESVFMQLNPFFKLDIPMSALKNAENTTP